MQISLELRRVRCSMSNIEWLIPKNTQQSLWRPPTTKFMLSYKRRNERIRSCEIISCLNCQQAQLQNTHMLEARRTRRFRDFQNLGKIKRLCAITNDIFLLNLKKIFLTLTGELDM